MNVIFVPFVKRPEECHKCNPSSYPVNEDVYFDGDTQGKLAIPIGSGDNPPVVIMSGESLIGPCERLGDDILCIGVPPYGGEFIGHFMDLTIFGSRVILPVADRLVSDGLDEIDDPLSPIGRI